MVASSWNEPDGQTSRASLYGTSFEGTHGLEESLVISRYNPASVDTNAPTRMQFTQPSLDESPWTDQTYNARVHFRFDYEEVMTVVNTAYRRRPRGTNHGDSGWAVTPTMFVVPASVFGNRTPGKFEMLTAGRNHLAFRAPADQRLRFANTYQASDPPTYLDRTFFIKGPRPNQLQAGTKYWVLILPMEILRSSTDHRTGNGLGHSHNRFVQGTTDVLDDQTYRDDVETLGRVFSFWTNRTPLAPVITSPTEGSSILAGADATLAFQSQDPDALLGLGDNPAWTDVAGVQVQYAEVQTPGAPAPVWRDLPFISTKEEPTPPDPGEYHSAVMADNPIVYYTFDGPSLETNSSSDGSARQLYGMKSWATAGPSLLPYQAGKSLVNFDTAGRIPVFEGDCTFEMWVHFAHRQDAVLLAREDHSAVEVSGNVSDPAGQDLIIQTLHSDGGTSTPLVSRTIPDLGARLQDGQAHHLVIVFGQNLKVYVDGSLEDSWTAAHPMNNPVVVHPFYLGAPYGGGVPGSLDEIAMYVGELPGERVQAHYFAGAGYPPAETGSLPKRLITDHGWSIKWAPGAPEGAETLRREHSVRLRAGTLDSTGGSAALPAGDWQIRMRTFDFGHQFPNAFPPLWQGATLTPAAYPSFNTSPWSTPVRVSVISQVPAVTPISPINNDVVVAGETVRLLWRYRNTAVEAYPQQSSRVTLRQVGHAPVTLLGGEDPWIDVPASTFTEGAQYEWSVQVKDSTGMESDPSVTSTFWVVPAPSSGPDKGLPKGTVDAATLGCGTHRAFIYKRGGEVRVGELSGISSLSWERLRDDVSNASVEVEDWGVDCGELLKKLQTWAYELVIFRDNGYSVERVWEGPITQIIYEQSKVTVRARDVMVYLYRRIIKNAMSDAGRGDTVVSRAVRAIQAGLAPDDPNLLRYLTPIFGHEDARQYRSTPAYSRTVYEEVDDMASNAGLDYTALGRSILVWGTRTAIGRLPEFRDADFGSAPIVSEYGMSFATRYAVSDGNGIWGEAFAPGLEDVSGNDPVYGTVEMLSSTWASDSEDEAGTYTPEGRAKVERSFQDYSETSIADRYPPPVIVRVPENTTLNPDAVVSIQHLVPGVAIPLRSSGTLRSVRATQKLDSVRVTEQGGRETISVSMSPFSRQDNEMGEEQG